MAVVRQVVREELARAFGVPASNGRSGHATARVSLFDGEADLAPVEPPAPLTVFFTDAIHDVLMKASGKALSAKEIADAIKAGDYALPPDSKITPLRVQNTTFRIFARGNARGWQRIRRGRSAYYSIPVKPQPQEARATG